MASSIGKAFISMAGTRFAEADRRTTRRKPRRTGLGRPRNRQLQDPRFLGRDNRPYGPLPRKWAQFKGTYAYGDQTVIAYSVGDASILEMDGMETDGGKGTRFTRTLEVGKSSKDLLARIAPDQVNVEVLGGNGVTVEKQDGFHVLKIPAAMTPTRTKC
ncbi:MAG: DUF6797 domain-containing protein [Gemmataceae bacterium]